MLDKVTNSEEQFNEGEVIIQDLVGANNDFEVKINFAMEETVTCPLSENAGISCVQFQTTQLTIVSDHHMMEINHDSETVVNCKERRLAVLHKSQDEELKAVIE